MLQVLRYGLQIICNTNLGHLFVRRSHCALSGLQVKMRLKKMSRINDADP